MRFQRITSNALVSATMIVLAITGITGTAHATITNSPGYIHLKNTRSGKCIDAQAAAPGTRLVAWRCLNTQYEEWQRIDVPIPGNRYEHCGCTKASMFVNHAMNQCIAVAEDQPGNATPVVQQTCNTSDEKQWWLISHISGYDEADIATFITSTQHLDVEGEGGSVDGAPIQTWARNFGTGYDWIDATGARI